MYNKETHEAIVHHWSRESTVGKKFVYSTAFNRINKKDTSGGVAVYNHYKVSFLHCNKFNKTLNGKNGHSSTVGATEWAVMAILLYFCKCRCQISEATTSGFQYIQLTKL